MPVYTGTTSWNSRPGCVSTRSSTRSRAATSGTELTDAPDREHRGRASSDALDPRDHHREDHGVERASTANRRARPTGTRRWPAGARRNGVRSGTGTGSGPPPTPRSARSTGRSTPPCVPRVWSLTAPVRAAVRPGRLARRLSSARPDGSPSASTRRWWRPTSASGLWSAAWPSWSGPSRWPSAVRRVRRTCSTTRARAPVGPATASVVPAWPVTVCRRERFRREVEMSPRTRVLECARPTTRRRRPSRSPVRPAGPPAAEARAADAEARAKAAERLLAAASADSAAVGAAMAAARAAEDRAAAAERRARELATLVCGEPRQLTRAELADLRDAGPTGPAVMANALRTLHGRPRGRRPPRADGRARRRGFGRGRLARSALT